MSCTIFVLLLIVLQMNADYPSNMGMYWGFSVGDNFYFTMNYTGEFDDLDDLQGRIQVDRFCEPLNYSGTLYNFGLGNDDITMFQYYNGQYWVMTDAFFMFSLLYCRVFPDGVVVCGGGSILTPFAFPIGNFSCLADLILERYDRDSVEFLESEDYWGFEVSGNRFYNNTSIYPNWNVTMLAHFDYCKDDGFLAHYHGITTYVDTGGIFQEVSLDRNGLDDQIMTPVSPFSTTSPIPTFSNTSPTSPITYVAPASLYEQLVQGAYMTAGIAWIVAFTYIIIDLRKRKALHS